MKTKIMILALITVFLQGCNNGNLLEKKIESDNAQKYLVDSEAEEKQSLTDTKWKLVEFVNADGISKTPETFSHIPHNCYWITFKSDNTLEGKSSSNLVLGHYEINQQLSNIQINAHIATYINELSDGYLFMKNLNSSYRYTTTKDTLKLYHTEKDYLLFNIYEDEKNNEQQIEQSTLLRGDWQWVKTYTGKQGLIGNEFKSILKIKNQNENSTVNYEIYVADTLFYSGIFSFLQTTYSNVSIVLPHWTANKNNQWNLYFHNENWIATKDTICFFSGNDDDYMYYYKKIKQ